MVELSPSKYKRYPEKGTAPITEQMPCLVGEGRFPLNSAGLMDAKREFVGTEFENYWFEDWHFLGDSALLSKKGGVKIYLDSPNLRKVNQDTILPEGAIPSSEETYKAVDARHFTRRQLEKMGINKPLTKDQAKRHPLWRIFAREDQCRLNDVVDVVFGLAKEKYDYDENMGIYLPGIPNNTEERIWYAGGLGGWSNAGAGIHLDDRFGRLVGVEKSAVGAAKNRDNGKVVSYNMADVERAVVDLDKMSEFVRPEAFHEVRSLITKLQQ